MLHAIRVNLGERSYEVGITRGDADGVGPFARRRARGDKALLVADENTADHTHALEMVLQGAGFQTGRAIRPAGEDQKSLQSAAELYDTLLDFRADRQTLVVAVGGGVIGDLAGFVAATFLRGLPLLMVPTTLLAMVDSSVGGKVAVNHPRGKNLIGAFHQPVGVWIDIETLATLPDREYHSGLAEVVKYGVALDAELFGFLEGHAEAILRREAESLAHVISRCCRLKADMVEKDERDTRGLRAILNYGHTFAHAFETVAGYGTWLHGEAVAAGMVCASRLAERRGLVAPEVRERQERLLRVFGLPTAPEPWPVEQIVAAMGRDKKVRAGALHFIVPRRIGEAVLLQDVAESEAAAALRADE